MQLALLHQKNLHRFRSITAVPVKSCRRNRTGHGQSIRARSTLSNHLVELLHLRRLKVNTDAQVLTQDGHVIPGLYAAGETVGIYHQVYTGSTSVLRGLTFGRIAASHMVSTK